MHTSAEEEVPLKIRSPRVPWMLFGAIGGWMVIAAFVIAAFLESTDLLPRLLTSKANSALAPYGWTVRMERASFGWFNRSLVLDRVEVQAEDASVQAGIQRARLVWDVSLTRGFYLSQIQVQTGHIAASSDGLRQKWAQIQSAQQGAMGEPSHGAKSPALLLENVSIEWLDGENLYDLGSLWLERSGEVADGDGCFLWALPTKGRDADTPPATLIGLLDLPEGGPVAVHAQVRELLLSELAFPTWLQRYMPDWQLRSLSGALSADFHWQAADWSAPISELEVQLRAREAHLQLTPSGPGSHSLAHLDLDTTLRFEGSLQSDWKHRDAWNGRLHALTRWMDSELRVQGLLGNEAHSTSFADLWVQTDALEVGEVLSERLGHNKTITDIQDMLAPLGSVQFAAGVRLPENFAWIEQRPIRIPIGLRVRSQGTASLAYVGGPNRHAEGLRNLGFPLRVDQVEGMVVFVASPSSEFSQRTGIFAVHGTAGQAPVRVEGGVWAPPFTQAMRDEAQDHPESSSLLADTRLSIQAEGLTFDDSMRAAFQGLSGVPGVQEILGTFGPNGGQVDVDLRFYGSHGAPNAVNSIAIRAAHLDAAWQPFPIPLQDASAQVDVLSDGGAADSGETLMRYRVEAKSPVLGAPLELAGHALSKGRHTLQSWTQAAISRLNLRSSALARALQAIDPTVRQTFEHAHLAGYLGADIQVVQAGPEGPMVAYALAIPEAEGLGALPAIFPIETSGLRGSVTARTEIRANPDRGLPPTMKWGARAEILGVSGVRNNGFPLALSLAIEPDGKLMSRITTADVDVDSPLIVGAIGQYLANDSTRFQAFDATAIPIAGRISGSCELMYQGVRTGPEMDLNLELHLDRFGPKGTEILRDLRGQITLSQADGSWAGKNLTGLLGDTPVQLHSLRVEPKEAGTQVEVEFSAVGVPIDRKHLEPFLEPELLRTLITDLDAAGTFDLNHTRLTLFLPESGPTALRLLGDVVLHQAFIRLGLPIEIASTRSVHLDLWYEGSHVRAMGTIEGLVGKMAERRLDGAKFQFTYVAPKLTIEEFDGEFEGGRLQSLGADADGAAGFLALDLVHPFRFSLSASMRGVDVGLLLAGVFNSDFANEGRLDGDIRLAGDVDHLTSVSGSGVALLSDSALWAIPVFQSLFSQLGFDTTATFKRMEARFRIDKGRIDLTHMQIKSDLLSLLGTGWVDFEGELNQDLEVRYSLVDRLGPITKLLYRIQNSLLRVSIRGDMARPQVHLGGLFSQFFRSREGERQLPLPGLSALPDHF